MPQIVMTKDQVLSLKVIEVKENVKQINGRKPAYRHDVYMEDKNGNTLKGEYLTQAPTYDSVFEKGVYQYIKCIGVNEFPNTGGAAYTIAPVPDNPPAKLAMARAIVDGVDVHPPFKERTATCYNRPVQGLSISFATAYAKDILVAQIAAGNIKDVTDEVVTKMLSWADSINEKMCERMDF